MEVSSAIKLAKNFSIELHEIVNNKQYTGEIRYKFSLALLQHALDINFAIIHLCEINLNGPAFSLARPILEAYLRALWLIELAPKVFLMDI